MNTINVLIVVDALGATSAGPTGGLQNNVYLIDTNKHDGSGAEGQAELYTACTSTTQGGNPIVWSIVPVDPGSDVSISSFTGNMISQKALIPIAYPNGSWQGTLAPNLAAGDIQYSVVVNIDGAQYSFDPFLQVSN